MNKGILRYPTKRDPYKHADIERVKMYSGSKYGAVLLAQEHYSNTLTLPHLIAMRREIKRFEDRMEIEAILFSSEKYQQFISGPDYKMMFHNAKQRFHGSKKVVEQYLVDIHAFITYISKFPKPFITFANGTMDSIGAGVCAASSTSIITDTSFVSLPECSKYGITPMGGLTFFLSRLPKELGAFLALTGAPLEGMDIPYCNLALKYIEPGFVNHTNFISNLDDLTKTFNNLDDNIMSLGYQLEKKNRWKFKLKQHYQENKKMYSGIKEEKVDGKIINKKNDWVVLEAKARQLILNRGDYHETQEFERLSQASNMIEYSGLAHSSARSQSLGRETRGTLQYEENLPVIRRCFRSDNIYEVLELLKEEGSHFATECVDIIQSSSPIAAQLTLTLMHEAKRLGYIECMLNEIAVATNRMFDDDFIYALEHDLFSPFKPEISWKYRDFKNISKDQIQSYFEKSAGLTGRGLGSVDYALLPSREFEGTFPELIRMWLNQDSLHVNRLYQYARQNLPFQMEQIGLCVSEHAGSSDLIRYEYMKLMQERYLKLEQESRAADIVFEEKIAKKFFNPRQELIDKFFASEEKYYSQMPAYIEKAFEKIYKINLELIKIASNNSQKIIKHRFFLRLKKFLLQNRVLRSMAESSWIDSKQILINKDHRSALDGQRSLGDRTPQLHDQTFSFFLAQTIRKEQLLPDRMMTYFLHEEDPEKFTRWFFDTDALESLREKLQREPELMRKFTKYYDKQCGEQLQPFLAFYKQYYKLLESGTTDFRTRDEYAQYKILRKKFNRLEIRLKQRLVEYLDNLIDISKEERLRRKAMVANMKVHIKKMKEVEPATIPKTYSDLVENYLANSPDTLPFIQFNATNPYIQNFSNLLKDIFTQILKSDVYQSSGAADLGILKDYNPSDIIDNFLLRKRVGRAMVHPSQEKLHHLFLYFSGPIINQQMLPLKSELKELNRLIKEKQLDPSKDNIEQIVDHFNKLKNIINKLQSSDILVQIPRRSVYENQNDFWPDASDLLSALQSSSLRKNDPEIIGKMVTQFRQIIEYTQLLHSAMKSIMNQFLVYPEILNDVEQNLFDIHNPKVVDKFTAAWSQHFHVHQLPITEKDKNLLRKECIDIISQNEKGPLISLLLKAIEKDHVLIPQLHKDLLLEPNETIEGLKFSICKYLNIFGVLTEFSFPEGDSSTDSSSETLKAFIPQFDKDENIQEGKELEFLSNIDTKNLIFLTPMTREDLTELFKNLDKKVKSEEDKQYLKEICNILVEYSESLPKNQEEKKTLYDIFGMSVVYQDDISEALQTPDASSVSTQSTDPEIQAVLAPTPEVKRLVKYFKNQIELLLLSNVENEQGKELLNNYITGRMRIVQYHPLYSKIIADEKKREDLIASLEQVISKELDLSEESFAPLGYHLNVKHIIPKPHIEGDEEYEIMKHTPVAEDSLIKPQLYHDYSHPGIDASEDRIEAAVENRFRKLQHARLEDPDFQTEPHGKRISFNQSSAQQEYEIISYLKEGLKAEKRESERWNPIQANNIDSPSEIELKKYYVERGESLRAAEELRRQMVELFDLGSVNPERGFMSLSGVKKLHRKKNILFEHDFLKVLELDAVTTRALYGSSFILNHDHERNYEDMKEPFAHGDIRYDPKQWFEETLLVELIRIFAPRAGLEQNMSFHQLQSMDMGILPALERSAMKDAMQTKLAEEYDYCQNLVSQHNIPEETKGNAEGYIAKIGTHHNLDMREAILKNKNMLFRKMAYDVSLRKRMKYEKRMDPTMFEEMYGSLLHLEAFSQKTFNP